MWAVIIVVVLLGVLGVLLGLSLRVVKQFERGLVFRFGRIQGEPRGPGLTGIVPIVDRLKKINMQIVTMPIPAQEGITRDNVTVSVDAVVYFRVIDPVLAVVNVQNYPFAVSQVAQTSLRSVIGKSDLDDLLSNRERLNQGLELMIDSPALDWGVHIDRVEIKDVALPEAMKRSMSRQAEAERERRARVISAEGELHGISETLTGCRSDGRHPGGVTTQTVGNNRLGRRREELHAGPPVSGGALAFPRAQLDGPARADATRWWPCDTDRST